MEHVLAAIYEHGGFNLCPWRCDRAHVEGVAIPVLEAGNGVRGSQT
jgi:hypothetical protein